MSSSRPDVLVHVADNVRRLRVSLGLSQVLLAERAGTSRRTILNLEAGVANMSLSGLDRLAEALGVTFVDLVAAPSSSASRIEAVAWRGASAASEAVLLGSAPAAAEAQLWHWSLEVGDRYDAEPDPAGWQEMIYVTSGRLRILFHESSVDIDAGDFTIYSSAQQYSYVNATDERTSFVRVVAS